MLDKFYPDRDSLNASMRRVRVAGCLLVAAAGIGMMGCGQAVEFRVTRLATLRSNPNHPVAIATVRVRAAAVRVLQTTRELKRVTGSQPHDLPGVWESHLQMIINRLQDSAASPGASTPNGPPITAYDLMSMLEELKAIVRDMRVDNPDMLADILKAGPNDQSKREDIKKALESVGELDLPEIESAVSAATASATFGGLSDSAVYKIDSASAEHELKQNAQGHIFSKVFVQATGDTATMLVQESPTEFHQCGLAADPTEVIRNTLVIANKVLRVVLSSLPVLGVPVPNAGASAGASVPASGANTGAAKADDTAEAAATASLTKLASDPLVLEVRQLLRDGKDVPKQKQDELLARVSAAISGAGASGSQDSK